MMCSRNPPEGVMCTVSRDLVPLEISSLLYLFKLYSSKIRVGMTFPSTLRVSPSSPFQ
jgi:hypothetical protein